MRAKDYITHLEEIQTGVRRVLFMHLELWDEKQAAYRKLEDALIRSDQTALNETAQGIRAKVRGEQRLLRLITPKAAYMKDMSRIAQQIISERLKKLPSRPNTDEDRAEEVALTSMKDIAKRLLRISKQAQKYFPYIEKRTEQELNLMSVLMESTVHELDKKAIGRTLKTLNKLFREDQKERKNLIAKTMDVGPLRNAIEEIKHTKPLRAGWQGALTTGAVLSSYSVGRGEFEAAQNLEGITGVGLLVSGAIMMGVYFFEYTRRLEEHAVVRLREEMANT